MTRTRISKVEVEVSTNNANFNKGFSDSQARMRQFNRVAITTQSNGDKLSNSFRNAGRNVAAFQGPMGGVSSRLGSIASLFGSLNPLVVATGLAFTGLSAMALASVSELDEYDLRMAKTNAILNATGGAAGLTADQIAELADNVAADTLASVNGVLDASNALLTFKSVQGEVFTNAIGLSQDLSAVMGTDIKSSALQLGKALEDPLTGLTSLRRAGVSFSESQKEMIKNMVETGNLAGSQKYILAELATQIGGSGAAESKESMAGAADLASQRWDELKKAFARTFELKAAAKSFFNTLSNGFESVTEAMGGSGDYESLVKAEEKLIELKKRRLRQDELLWSHNLEVGPSKRKKVIDEISDQEALIAKIKEKHRVSDERAAKSAALIKQEATNKKFKADSEAGQKTLAALDARLSDEQEKMNHAWEVREAQIQDLVVTELEIKSRGYESLEQLKDYYRTLSDEKLDEDFAKLEEKEQVHRDKKQKADEDADAKRIAAKLAVDQIIFKQEQNLTNNLLRLGHGLAEGNEKSQKAMLAVDTAIQVVRAINAANVAANAVMIPEAATKGYAAAVAASTNIRMLGYANAAAIGLGGALSLSNVGEGSGLGSGPGSSSEGDQPYEAVLAQQSSERAEVPGQVVIQQTIEIKALDGASVLDVVNNNKDVFLAPVLERIQETGSLV